MNDVARREEKKAKEIAKKYINSANPEMRKLAREILDME